MRKPAFFLSIVFVGALLWGALRGQADDRRHNSYGITPECYAIYARAISQQRHSEAETMALADSMNALAISQGDVKAQCLALDLGINYYESAGPEASEKLRQAVERQCDFALSTPYKQFYYNALSTLILHYISYGNYSNALTEINRMQDTAFKTNNAYGVGQSHYLLAQLYQAIGMNQAAIEELKVGMSYAIEHEDRGDDYRFLYALLQQYERTDNIDSALIYIDKLQDLPQTTPSQHIYSMLMLASHYRKQQRWDKLKQQLNQIERRKGIDNISNDYLSLFLQNKAIYISHAEGDSAEALRLCQQIRVKQVKYDTQREIYQHYGNYKKAFEAKKMLSAQTSSINFKRIMADTKTVDAIIKTNHLHEMQKKSEFEKNQLQLSRDSIARLHEQYQLQIEQREADRKAEEYNNLIAQMANSKIEHERDSLQSIEKQSLENAIHANRLLHRTARQNRLIVAIISITVLVAFLIIMAIRLRSSGVKANMQKSLTKAQQAKTQLKETLLLNLRDDLRQPFNELRDRVVIISGATDTRIAAIISKAIHQRTETIIQLVDEMIEKAEQDRQLNENGGVRL